MVKLNSNGIIFVMDELIKVTFLNHSFPFYYGISKGLVSRPKTMSFESSVPILSRHLPLITRYAVLLSIVAIVSLHPPGPNCPQLCVNSNNTTQLFAASSAET